MYGVRREVVLREYRRGKSGEGNAEGKGLAVVFKTREGSVPAASITPFTFLNICSYLHGGRVSITRPQLE